jgi:hypothetical protein
MKLIQVHAPHFCAGFVSDGERVTEAAPILKYLVGRTEDFARSYLRKKGWRASVVVESFKQSAT